MKVEPKARLWIKSITRVSHQFTIYSRDFCVTIVTLDYLSWQYYFCQTSPMQWWILWWDSDGYQKRSKYLWALADGNSARNEGLVLCQLGCPKYREKYCKMVGLESDWISMKYRAAGEVWMKSCHLRIRPFYNTFRDIWATSWHWTVLHDIKANSQRVEKYINVSLISVIDLKSITDISEVYNCSTIHQKQGNVRHLLASGRARALGPFKRDVVSSNELK